MPDKIWIGIDCGKHGAIAVISSAKVLHSEHTCVRVDRKKKRTKKGAKSKYSIKTEYNLDGMLSQLHRMITLAECRDVVVVIEQQRQRPSDSKQTVFQIGYGQGLWEMAIAAVSRELARTNSTVELSVVKVLPSQWKPRYVEPGSDKKASLLACKTLYPKHELPLAKDEARAEATLIADFVMRQQLNKLYLRANTINAKD